RGLDLVEEIERTWPREEEREEEGDRAERLLAAGEEREPLHALPRGTQLDLDAGLLLVLVVVCGLGQTEPAFAAREDGRRHVREVTLDGVERLGEAALDRLRQLV